MKESASNNEPELFDIAPGDKKESSNVGALVQAAEEKNNSQSFGWIGFAVAGLGLCALPIVLLAIGLPFQYLLLLFAVPCFLIAKGFHSMQTFKRRAILGIRSNVPIKMTITSMTRQRLWFNSVDDKSSFRIDLEPLDSDKSKFSGIKVDADNEQASLFWQSMFDGIAKGDKEVVQVYVDENGVPVAVIAGEALAWRAGWWGDS